MRQPTDKARQEVRMEFQFRLSRRSPQDLQLARWIARDIASGKVNISAVIRNLLYDWYLLRERDGGLPSSISLLGGLPAQDRHEHEQEALEDPDDELVRRMAAADFSALAQPLN